jgi:hypothetical protein
MLIVKIIKIFYQTIKNGVNSLKPKTETPIPIKPQVTLQFHHFVMSKLEKKKYSK